VASYSRGKTAAVLGVFAGAVGGYLLFTDRGRSLRRQCEAAIENTARELNSFSATVRKIVVLATEGLTLLNEAFGDGRAEAPRYPTARQTAPL
jgi:hypothetical protein